ncbi:hypothetical protein BKA66DRAFT_471989 [Pyrenochaeta sp. MPI-SDFR-AT-0127]|nr:hypothetical protein BKA66DRAFT_471989 [Pyrenochaeta sp. MPI-SDFR-AT-0127]
MKFSSTLLSYLVTSSLAANVRTVYQFSNPTWLENIAAMRNGSLLVTVIGRPEVHLVDPHVQPSTSSLIASFPNTNAVLGISEISDNVFAVAAGNTTPANAPVLGTYGIWKIDLSQKKSKFQKIADLPNVDMVNGIVKLNDHTLLMADSWAGNIVTLNTRTGAYRVALSDASLASNFSVPALPLGVNGIKIHNGYLYYSNTVQARLGRVRISPTGEPTGPFTTLASVPQISVPDDFAVAKDGSVYLTGPLAAPQGDTLQHITLDGKIETVAKGGAVVGATAATFGRTRTDRNTVYLSTMGGFGSDGVPLAGGRVVAVSLD